MNQKAIIITISILSVVGLVFIFILLFQNDPATENPQSQSNPGTYTSYQISVTEKDGQASTTLLAEKKIFQLTPETQSKYATVSFNSPRDIMWINCPEGYNYSSPTSSTGNKITEVSLLSEVNIEISPGRPNNLTLTCTQINNSTK